MNRKAASPAITAATIAETNRLGREALAAFKARRARASEFSASLTVDSITFESQTGRVAALLQQISRVPA